MTYDQLKAMPLGDLVDMATLDEHNEQEQLQAREAALARLPEWDGQGLLGDQLQRLIHMAREAELEAVA